MKQLENLRWKPKWTTHMGCIKGCLDYLGIDVSDAWLFGGTGHAFVINIPDGVCPSGPTAWQSEILLTLGRNLGCTLDHVGAHKSQPDFAETRQRACHSIRQAIDEGFPCYGWEFEVPEFYVVYGYDDDGCYFSGPMCDDGKGPKAWDALGETDIGWLEIVTVRPGDAADDTKTVKDALGFAVAQARDPEKWAAMTGRMGLAGYDKWIETMQANNANGMGMAYNAAVWAECREHAVDFLKEARQRLNGNTDQLFKIAIEHYRTVAQELAAVAKLFPFLDTTDEQKDQNVQNPIRRQTGIIHLRDARMVEEAGIETLEKIIAAL